MVKLHVMDQKRRYKKAPLEAHNEERLSYLGLLLREYRYETMLSLEDFASEFGISRSLLERIENGSNITLHSLLRILDIFQISPAEIFEGVE
jgi:transcriptional regulator with XRE-family HTH domain